MNFSPYVLPPHVRHRAAAIVHAGGHWIAIAAFCSTAVLTASHQPASQSPTPSATPSAAPSVPAAVQAQGRQTFDVPAPREEVERSIVGGETHDWTIDLAAGEIVRIAIDSHQVDLAVTVTGPDEASIAEYRGANVMLGLNLPRTVISPIAEKAGRYRLRITTLDATGPGGRYQLRLEDRHAATEPDRQRLAAYTLWNEGARLFRLRTPNDMRAAMAKYEDALSVLDSIGLGAIGLGAIGAREDQALTLHTLAYLAYDLSEARQGIVFATRALAIWEGLGRECETGIALSDLGSFAHLTYDFTTARGYFDRAIVKHQAVHDVRAEAIALTGLGWVHFALGNLPSVIEVNERALPLWRDLSDRTGESIAYNDLGRAYVDLGEVTQALDAFERALALRPPDRDPRGAANILLRVGVLYDSVAEWPRALDALHQAVDLARRAHDERTEASVLVNLGSVYASLNDPEEAIRYLELALTSARKVGHRVAEGNALVWLARAVHLNGEMTRSLEYLQQALAVLTSIQNVRGQGLALRELAKVQLALGQPQQALQTIEQSVEVAPQARGVVYSAALTRANIYAELGDVPKAMANYEAALAQTRDIRARDLEASTLGYYGSFQARQGRYAEARDLLRQSLAIRESLRSLITDPDQRASVMSRAPYQTYIDVLMELHRASPDQGLASDAFSTNERARARGLLDLLALSSVNVREGVDAALLDRERALRWNLNAKAAIQSSLLSGNRDQRRLETLEREIAEISAQLREVNASIHRASPAYASLVEPQPLTAEEAGRQLDADTVLLEFALGRNRSWLFAVTDHSFETFVLPPRQEIHDAASDVYKLLTARQPVAGESAADRQTRIAQADTALNDRTRALSDLVFGPIAAKLATDWRGRRLAIVAAGALEYIPFAALPLPRAAMSSPTPGQTAAPSSTPLIAAHEVVMLPSASILPLLRRESASRAPATKSVAVLADPVFAADDPRVSRPLTRRHGTPVTEVAVRSETASRSETSETIATRALEPFLAGGTRGSLARLPFSRSEALAVAAQVPRASLLQAIDFEASLQLATSGRLADYRIVHFATHGLINTTRPELSGLALSLVDREGRTRDGFLRLNTIYNMRLSADVVVLSACQSALGKEVAGEGLVGLTRGFMYAGARRVIASLWQVSDVATAELMKKFYAGMLQRRLAPAAALRQAQLEMSQDPRWAAPYFWAGFVLQGDWK